MTRILMSPNNKTLRTLLGYLIGVTNIQNNVIDDDNLYF